jgi:hypothetical protein
LPLEYFSCSRQLNMWGRMEIIWLPPDKLFFLLGTNGLPHKGDNPCF